MQDFCINTERSNAGGSHIFESGFSHQSKMTGNYEKYHEGQMNQKQFMEEKMQLEEERERLQKRVQELGELINGEKEILMKKNVPVEQMLMYLGYEKLTREMLEEYVQGIYVYDDGRVEVEWKE